ncbi:MAG: hypothetical protein HRT68_10575, partial [Flavobacteriaceae bacterium]|nr:hypothetical protein [Flavobacteriaceae bacterium]
MIESGDYSVFQIQAEAEAHFNIVGTDRGVGYKPYKRWEYQAQRLMDQNGMLKSPDEYYNDLIQYQQDFNSNSFSSFQGNWTQLGPTYWDDSNSNGWNPGVGRITSLAIDPADENHIIVGGPTGGVWKSVDGGTNWTVLTDNLANIDVYALTMDPTNTSIYYWGSTGGNIYRSTDAGATWSFYADAGNGTVNKILIDPTNTSKMYCTASGGIYKSTDTGLTWNLINPSATNGYDIEFKPGDTNTIYASGTNYFYSTDGGNTFSAPQAFTQWSQEYISGAADWTISDTNQNNTITPRTGSGMAHFYSGNFNGDSTRLISDPINLSGATNPRLNFYYANVNWAGDIDEVRVLYRTSATGAWTQIASYTAEMTSWTSVTLNLPSPSANYYIAFEGISRYGRGFNIDDLTVTTDNLGTVFQEGFENSGVAYGGGVKMMGVSPDDPTVVYMLEESGGIFGGFYKSTDSGASFTELDHTGKNYFGYSSSASDDRGQAPRDMDVAVDPNDVNEVHIAGILSWRSTDGGVTFNITSQWIPGSAAGQNIGYCHADIDLLMFYGPNLYVASDGGLFVAENTNTVNANYYRDLTTGIGLREFYKIGISRGNTEVVTGGAQDNGSSVYTSSGV